MAYELVKVELNSVYVDCYDLHIKNLKTGKVLVADGVKIWEDEQESLEEMFTAVLDGEW